MSKTLLEISKVQISYDRGKSYILKDISFCLESGEILSIIGKNGAGKSSLLKAIAGVEDVYSGDIQRHTNKVSYIPQKIHLEKSFPLKIEEFFKVFNDTVSEEKIGELFKIFDIEALRKRNIHTISGGEFQKILIVNALLSNPDLLLMDEPTSGIDMIGEEQFYKNIADIRAVYPEIAIILVSHNLHLVYKNSSRVICLHGNNLCCHGSPREVLENKDVSTIFGKYVRPYEHAPHSHHHNQ